MVRDSRGYTLRCGKCQRLAPMTHQLAEEMNLMVSTWNFVQWGLDLIVPFKRAKGNKEYLMVVMDYFTKWIEAKPLSLITKAAIKAFL